MAIHDYIAQLSYSLAQKCIDIEIDQLIPL